jgi:hypothetical protein
VPEGSFIVRAHTPMSNLFSCLWFNEVERFTPRDQLSFAYTYLKLARTNPTTTFRLNMFKVFEVLSIVHRTIFTTICVLSVSRIWLGFNTFGWCSFQECTFFIHLAQNVIWAYVSSWDKVKSFKNVNLLECMNFKPQSLHCVELV